MQSKISGKLWIALTVAVVLHECCGCTSLMTARGAASATSSFTDVSDPIVESLEAVKENAEDSVDGVGEQVQQGRGQWGEFVHELNRFFAFGDPEEMNSSPFDSISDKQMKAMRAEIDGSSSLR